MKLFPRWANLPRATVIASLGCFCVATPAAGLIKGIDVSKWQYFMNWNTVATQTDTEFAFIKYTDSSSIIDDRAGRNVALAANAGIPFGVYHFATPFAQTRNDPQNFAVSDAVEEAEWFVQNAGDYMGYGYLPPVLDIEVGEAAGRTLLTNWSKTFLDTVQSLTGVRPIVYANQNWVMNYLTASVVDADLWIARWTDDPNVGPSNLGSWNDYLFHQYTSTMVLPGVTGNTVDGNTFNGTAAEFQRLLYPTVIPEPATIAFSAAIPVLMRRRRVSA